MNLQALNIDTLIAVVSDLSQDADKETLIEVINVLSNPNVEVYVVDNSWHDSPGYGKIDAIKWVRLVTGWGLKESKEAVENGVRFTITTSQYEEGKALLAGKEWVICRA
jgi:hypothetical protein